MKKILVIGDACVDVFYYGSADRIAPEAPVPVLNIEKKVESPAMAINVANNVDSLGADCEYFSNNNWRELTKERYVHYNTNHMLLRVDNDKGKYPRCDQKTLKNIEYSKYDAVIISDYNKGFLTEEDIEFVSSQNKNVFVDTKKILGPWCENVRYIKINTSEYNRTQHTLTKKLREKLIVTKGPLGSIHADVLYPAKEVEVKDVSGAGDSYLAGLVVKYLENEDIAQAISFATECATKVVQKRGVSVI